MLAYKQYVTIKDPAKIELSGLPFRAGQRVEVVMIAEDDDRETRIEELRTLFRSTQTLPQTKAITDEMIAEEVEAYRAGR
jgi:antitoxin ParD1/3/4